jgi:hypothetical protein
MATRDEMIEKLSAMKGVYADYLGTCVAGFDIEVASSDGAGTACCQAGSPNVMGPIQLSAKVRDLLKKAPASGDDDELADALAGIDEEELPVLRQMVARKCKVNTDYYYFFMGEDAGSIELGTNEEKVRESWGAWAFEGTELTPWEDMEDEELEEWFEKV